MPLEDWTKTLRIQIKHGVSILVLLKKNLFNRVIDNNSFSWEQLITTGDIPGD